jgi:hypothetical protein
MLKLVTQNIVVNNNLKKIWEAVQHLKVCPECQARFLAVQKHYAKKTLDKHKIT